VGPLDVDTDEVDFSNEPKWAAHHETVKVNHFEAKLRAGEELPPVVLVDTPGDPKLKVVDGHHRVLAARNLGRPITAYVGRVPTVVGPWDTAHSHQVHGGSDRANKTTDRPMKG
jgi:hypothetical protein